MTLIFSIHYFLWYGALTSLFGYESVYARRYTNASPMQYGYLNMMLPFATVLATPVICSLADRRQSHRSYFTISLILTVVAMSLYALLPVAVGTEEPSEQARGPLLLGPWIYYCLTSLLCDLSMGVNTCLSDSFAVLQAEEQGTSFGRVIVWGTFGWASSALVLSVVNQWSLLPRLLPGLVFGVLLLTVDVLVVSFWPRAQDFKLDAIPAHAAQSVTGSASSTRREPSDYMPLNESARINLGPEIEARQVARRKTMSPLQLVAKASPQQEEAASPPGLDSSIKTIDSELDATGRKGLSPPSLPLPAHVPSQASPRNRSGGGSPAAAVATSFRMQFLLLALILRRRKSLLRYLVLFILSGFFMSMHWNYFFLYLEQIHFKQFELISALSMVGQSILGELPFFILSRKFIDFFGRSHTLSFSVISIGIRFLLYSLLLPNVSMYCIVLADCFQGPNYGLFYVVMTEVGLEYSYCDDETIDKLARKGELDRHNQRQVDLVRLSLRSTVQSVAFACYEGLGVGLGSLVGGWIVANHGFHALWLSTAVGSISVGLMNMLIELWCRRSQSQSRQVSDWEGSERREFREAQRRGILKKLASPAQPPFDTKVQMLVRKSAGWLVAPRVAPTDAR